MQITLEDFINYFNNMEYIDADLLWSLSNESLHEQWKYIITQYIFKNEQTSNFIPAYTSDDYNDMYRALIRIESSNLE